ncbi:MAG TPA: ribonuclease Y [Bacteroidetes bacterium]|nr:ribonuclease Y [Bacteroidota bacterium]
MNVFIEVVLAVLIVAAFFLGRYLRLQFGKAKIADAEQIVKTIIADAKKEAADIKKSKILEGKDQLYQLKIKQENEIRQKRKELHRFEKQFANREENMDRKADLLKKQEDSLARLQQDILKREQYIKSKREHLNELIDEQVVRLETISGLTQEEARNLLVEKLKESAKEDAAQIMKDIRDQARVTAHREAKEMIIEAIQRTAVDHTTESTVTVVRLPADEMKGRIIGREGRNIRAFEMETGVEVIVDDTPEAVILSCFHPVRREIAKIALEKLISDGRIHPGRIEDVVIKAKEEMEERIHEIGEKTLLEVGVHGLHFDLVKALGKLKFKSTYGQNVLQHSIEAAHLAEYMAVELGFDPIIAKRAGLLHDIGKAVDSGKDEKVAKLGMELAKKCGEGPIVQNAIAALDGESAIIHPITVLVQAANNISISRPGAKRETLEEYIQRLQKLETITGEIEGVERSFAIQAGREIRVIVNPEEISDIEVDQLAIKITRRIREAMEYPGQIKVTVIREYRIVDYAK